MSAAAKLAGPRERPILFSAPTITALLEGRKTQTRRLVKKPLHEPLMERAFAPGCGVYRGADGSEVRSPWQPGDLLWVREAWGVLHDDHVRHRRADMVIFRSTEGHHHGNRYQLWRPSIFMPRWASRITLEVTEVRVQRLHEISEEDARAEGVCAMPHGCCRRCNGAGRNVAFPDGCPDCSGSRHAHRTAFRSLWNTLHTKREHRWLEGERELSPWVWAASFRRVTP